MELSDRQRDILSEIIEEFIATAEPIGSRTLAKRKSVQVSPATVRNTMSDLEELGLLSAPHASAGRVPTPLAFRYYVERLAHRGRISSKDRELIRAITLNNSADIREVLREAGKILSSIAKHAALVIMPPFESIIFESIDLLPLRDNSILAVFVARSGFIQHRVIEVAFVVQRDELTRMSNYLKSIIEGRNLRAIRAEIIRAMSDERAQADRLMQQALFVGQQALHDTEDGNLLVAGERTFLDQPEFADIEKMRKLLRAFEEKTILLRLLDLAALNPIGSHAANRSETLVVLGSESSARDLKELAAVTSTYDTDEGQAGKIGVIGPTRMDYSRVIPLVEMTAKAISREP